MLYFPNTLPSFAKMLIGFRDIYRRMWKNIYPCSSEVSVDTLSPSLRFLASDLPCFLAVMGVELALGFGAEALALFDVVVVVVVRLAMDRLAAGELIVRLESAIITLSGVDDITCD